MGNAMKASVFEQHSLVPVDLPEFRYSSGNFLAERRNSSEVVSHFKSHPGMVEITNTGKFKHFPIVSISKVDFEKVVSFREDFNKGQAALVSKLKLDLDALFLAIDNTVNAISASVDMAESLSRQIGALDKAKSIIEARIRAEFSYELVSMGEPKKFDDPVVSDEEVDDLPD